VEEEEGQVSTINRALSRVETRPPNTDYQIHNIFVEKGGFFFEMFNFWMLILPHNTTFQDVFEISIQLNILVKRLTLGK
jgi:hypothetical protein